MDITLHLPVRSYVYKYCKYIFGEAGKPFEVWRFSLHLKESKVLYALLKRSPHRYEKLNRNDTVFNILIPAKIVAVKGCHLTQEDVDLFNDYIKLVILDEILNFYTGINTRIGLKTIDKVTINQSQPEKKCRVVRLKPEKAKDFFWQKNIIFDILAKYDITEDEISYDSIVKHLQRNSNSHYSA